MSITKTDILEFIPKLEASRENLVDDVLQESRTQTALPQNDKKPERFNELMAELAHVQLALSAFREEADKRRV